MNTSKAERREPTYFLLASLLDGPLHGYAIIQRAAELSDGRVRMATGTLYTALDRLTAEGSGRVGAAAGGRGRGDVGEARERRAPPLVRADRVRLGRAAGRGDADGGRRRAGDE